MDHKGNKWAFQEGPFVFPTAFYQALRDAIYLQACQVAAQHRNGEGLEAGFDLSAVHTFLGQLTRKEWYQTRGLLQAIVTGGLWPDQRLHEIKPQATSGRCRFCGKGPETEAHLAWWCEVIQAKDCPIIQQTNSMVKVAQRNLSKGIAVPYGPEV